MKQFCIFLHGDIIDVVESEDAVAIAKHIAQTYAHPEAFLAVEKANATQDAKALSITISNNSAKARGVV